MVTARRAICTRRAGREREGEGEWCSYSARSLEVREGEGGHGGSGRGWVLVRAMQWWTESGGATNWGSCYARQRSGELGAPTTARGKGRR